MSTTPPTGTTGTGPISVPSGFYTTNTADTLTAQIQFLRTDYMAQLRALRSDNQTKFDHLTACIIQMLRGMIGNAATVPNSSGTFSTSQTQSLSVIPKTPQNQKQSGSRDGGSRDDDTKPKGGKHSGKRKKTKKHPISANSPPRPKKSQDDDTSSLSSPGRASNHQQQQPYKNNQRAGHAVHPTRKFSGTRDNKTEGDGPTKSDTGSAGCGSNSGNNRLRFLERRDLVWGTSSYTWKGMVLANDRTHTHSPQLLNTSPPQPSTLKSDACKNPSPPSSRSPEQPTLGWTSVNSANLSTDFGANVMAACPQSSPLWHNQHPRRGRSRRRRRFQLRRRRRQSTDASSHVRIAARDEQRQRSMIQRGSFSHHPERRWTP